MTAPAICNTTETVHGIATSLGAVARQASLPRIVGTVVGITVLVVVALLVPVPTAVELRDWAKSLGAWFPLAFCWCIPSSRCRHSPHRVHVGRRAVVRLCGGRIHRGGRQHR